MTKKIFALGIAILFIALGASNANASFELPESENNQQPTKTGGFYLKDDGGRTWNIHDVDLSGHMELYSDCGNKLAGPAWCLVANKYRLNGGEKTTFSISGHINGYLYSPTLEDVAEITIKLVIYKNFYLPEFRWKEITIYYEDCPGPENKPVSGSVTIPGNEIESGEYIVAFQASICASSRTGNNDIAQACADFHTGNYCVEAYTATATQEENPEAKPDLTFRGIPTWDPNPPVRGRNVKFHCVIKNIGEGDCRTGFGVQIKLDGDVYGFVTVDRYDINGDNQAEICFSFSWPSDLPLERKVTIIIDAYNFNNGGEIDEGNENNNKWSTTIKAKFSQDASQSETENSIQTTNTQATSTSSLETNLISSDESGSGDQFNSSQTADSSVTDPITK